MLLLVFCRNTQEILFTLVVGLSVIFLSLPDQILALQNHPKKSPKILFLSNAKINQ